MTDINATAPRPDIGGDWPDGSLPEQMGGARQTLMPAVYTFRLPQNLAQLWHEIEIEDSRQFLANGQPNPTYKQKVKRAQIKCDRNSPLVVEGGAQDGAPMIVSVSTNPRPRGKKDDPKTPWIADLAYVLEVGLGDKSRPTTTEALKAAINKHAGRTLRLETGLSAQCRPDKVRYILLQTTAGESTLQDPSGQKGCGSRYYTKDFKDPSSGKYDTEIQCDCGGVLRGFEQVERILPPLGS